MDDHTIQEIRGYNRPAPVVHNVMRSTYTLLGEKEGLNVGSPMYKQQYIYILRILNECSCTCIIEFTKKLRNNDTIRCFAEYLIDFSQRVKQNRK